MSQPERAPKEHLELDDWKTRTKVPGINEEEQLFEEIWTCNKLAAINEAARAAAGSKTAFASAAAATAAAAGSASSLHKQQALGWKCWPVRRPVKWNAEWITIPSLFLLLNISTYSLHDVYPPWHTLRVAQ